MIKQIIIILLIISLFSCNKISENQENVKSIKENVAETKIQKTEKPFFDFDKVEHYFKNISENDALDIILKENPSKEEKALIDILENGNMNYTDNLEKYNFKKTLIEDSKFNSIKEVFSEKKCDSAYAAACTPIYRDVFIFKKDNKITGKAKVCFGCRLFYIEGTKQNVENFGQCGDFEKLIELVR